MIGFIKNFCFIRLLENYLLTQKHSYFIVKSINLLVKLKLREDSQLLGDFRFYSEMQPY